MKEGEILLLGLILVAVLASPSIGHLYPICDLVRSAGYPCEDHEVETKDGYLLGVQRIPAPHDGVESKGTVVLQHGLLDSGATWVNNMAFQSLGFILHDAGYDVFISNSRGTQYSLKHKTLSPDSDAFWEYSYIDLGMYDLPAVFSYARNLTGEQKISYIGHSLGTMMAFAALSVQPSLADQMKVFIALAPVVYTKHQTCLFFSTIMDLGLDKLFRPLHMHEFLPNSEFFQRFGMACEVFPFACRDGLMFLTGCNPRNLNSSRFDVYLKYSPAGTSVNNTEHLCQNTRAGAFREYDYGAEGNLRHYGQKEPPGYDMSKIRVPMSIFYGEDDEIGDPADVGHLLTELPAPYLNHVEEITGYTHLDFVWGMDAHVRLYPKVLETLEKFRS